MSKKGGFTLLEIMVAVAIMMIISAVGLSGFIFSQQKSRDAKRKSDLAQVARALEVFNEDFGSYPGDDAGVIEGCDTPPSFSECGWGGEFRAFLGGVEQIYMSRLPEDPKTSLYYYYDSNGESFSLYAVLENDKDKDYRSDLSEQCGTDVNCNYMLTEYGVEVE